MFVDLVRELSCYLESIKRKKDNFKYKVLLEKDKIKVFLKRLENNDSYEFVISYDASPTLINYLDIKDDLANLLFEL
jgi:hypothetical protein